MEDPIVDVRLAAVAAYPALVTDPAGAAPALCARLSDADPGVRAGIFAYNVAPLSVFYPWRE